MATLIMKGGQMVVETDDEAERETLSALAYAVTEVEIEAVQDDADDADDKPAKRSSSRKKGASE